MRETVSRQMIFEWSEAKAIRRAQVGDAAAFEYLCTSHSKHVCTEFPRTLALIQAII